MKQLIVCTLVACLCSGCMSTTSIGAGSQRKQLILLPESYVAKRGNKTFKHLSGQTDTHIYDAEDERLVQIMNRLIPYAEEYLDEGENIDWTIHEWHPKRINSRSLGNGAILIGQQFTRHSEFSDENLALLVAHEMAHIIRHHPQEFYSWKYLLSPALFASSFLTSGVTSIATSAGQDFYNIGFKHSAEKEADLLGLEIYAKAGFDPEHASEFLLKAEPLFKKDHPIASKVPAWIKSHPSFSARKKAMQKYQPKVAEMYAQHVEKTSTHLIQWNFEQHYKADNLRR